MQFCSLMKGTYGWYKCKHLFMATWHSQSLFQNAKWQHLHKLVYACNCGPPIVPLLFILFFAKAPIGFVHSFKLCTLLSSFVVLVLFECIYLLTHTTICVAVSVLISLCPVGKSYCSTLKNKKLTYLCPQSLASPNILCTSLFLGPHLVCNVNTQILLFNTVKKKNHMWTCVCPHSVTSPLLHFFCSEVHTLYVIL